MSIKVGQVWRCGDRVVTVQQIQYPRALVVPHPDGLPNQRAAWRLLRGRGRTWADGTGWQLVSEPDGDHQ